MPGKNNRINQPDYLSLGQSSSQIIFGTNEHGIKTVQKSTETDPARLYFQFEKHLAAQDGRMSPLKVPSVIGDFEVSSYKMEFSSGIPLGFFLILADRHEVQAVSQSILRYFDLILENSKPDLKSVSQDFDTKLQNIALKLDSTQGNFDFISKLIEICLNVLPEIELRSGWNHGDFSFENLLVDRDTGEVTAIDFLDSPFETPFIDFGRFWLDAKYGWWGAGLAPSANFSLNAKALMASLAGFQKTSKFDSRILPLFAGLAVSRIVPYTTNPTRMAFLKNAAWRIGEDLK